MVGGVVVQVLCEGDLFHLVADCCLGLVENWPTVLVHNWEGVGKCMQLGFEQLVGRVLLLGLGWGV